jgi:hypothetical protein
MSEYIELDDAIAHQEWFAENYIIDLETGRIIQAD